MIVLARKAPAHKIVLGIDCFKGRPFSAAVVIKGNRVVRWAPIVAYMEGWSHQKVINYCHRRGWNCYEC